MFHLNLFQDEIICLMNHQWISRVFEFFTDDKIDAQTLINVFKWLLENAC